jgi:serine/threonine protein kinase/tetratricopeptide (TPR) repeat protein
VDASRWEQIQKLFHEAALLPAAEQRDFLEAACANNKPLMEDVLGLLREDASSSISLLDQPLAEVAHRVLEDGGNELPLQELGPYRIRKMLGEGGMGVVYLAERPDLGSLVALKLLRDAWLSPARRERFAAEQRTLAQLNHPSIGRLYDADTLPDGTPFFVMEYVEGLPLTDYCKQHRSSIDQRLHLFRQVCEAVQYAHSNTVIHRDLKPSNILVKSDGTVRLLDFGIAKQLESLDVPTHQTMTALRLMTPAYASPEQIRGQRVGIQTDVYSLGVILYELVSGELPFDLTNLSPAEAEMVLVSHEPPRPSTKVASHILPSDGPAATLSAGSRADLDVLCLTAMHKDPERRYRSVEALMRDVDHYLAGEPLEARPDTLRYRASKFVRRNRREVMAAAAALAVVIGLVLFFTVRLTRARDAALAEAARTHRIQSFMMSLFQGGDESVGPSDELKVIALVDRGVQEARTLDADPKVQVELYQTLGSIYEGLGKFDQAHSLFQSAYDKSKSAFGGESLEVAQTLIGFGQLHNDQAEYAEAEKSIREGLAIGKRKLPANHPFLAKATAELGAILANRGEYDQAIDVLNEAARLQSQSGASTADQAANLTELANAHFYRGDYPIADALNKRVLEMDRKLYGNRHPNVGEDLINIGALQFQLGHFAEAEQYQRQALDIIQGFFGKDHPETASVRTALGRALVPQGRLDEANEMLHQALATHERVYGPVHPRVAAALIEIGKVAQQQAKFDDAEADFQRAVDIYRKVYAGKHYYIGNALCNLGGVSMERKQYARAEHIYREALEMFAKTLTPEHQLVGVGRVRLGRSLLRQGRYTEAEAESRPGYEILAKQETPPVVWMQNVRNDLIEEYDALHQPEKAGKIRAELAASESKTLETTAKK